MKAGSADSSPGVCVYSGGLRLKWFAPWFQLSLHVKLGGSAPSALNTIRRQTQLGMPQHAKIWVASMELRNNWFAIDRAETWGARRY